MLGYTSWQVTLIGAIAALNWVCGAWFTLCEMEVALCAAF